MSKILYISDLDGTLLSNKSGLKDRAAELIKRLSQKGVLFTYATARRFCSAGFRMARAEIKLPVILMNGVIIADGESGRVIKLNGLAHTDLSEIKKAVEQYGEVPIVHSFIDGEQRASYLESQKERIASYVKDHKNDNTIRPCGSYDDLFEGDIHYFTFINSSLPMELKNKLFCREKGLSYIEYYDNYHKDELWTEVFSASATKANAVLQLKEMLGADELVCFGDNLNDISMFRAADRAYAVSNAKEELKAEADGVIGSNEQISVPKFIEAEQSKIFDYTPHENPVNAPDCVRFEKALEKAKESARQRSGIGTLNEKTIHAALKNYFSNDYDQEAKIGSFYADIVTENGIFEIQTGNFNKLNKKLEVMLSVCHVTVVYPFEKRTRTVTVSDTGGEVLREGGFRTDSSLTKFFLELYRIKSFLTDPNLSVCVAELDVERVNYVSEKTGRRRKRGAYTKTPLSLRREIYLEKPEDYFVFLPERLSGEFTVKELQGLVRTTDAKLMLEVLLYLGVVDKVGKRGNAEVYRVEK